MNQSRRILRNYRVHLQRRYFNLLMLLRPANLSTHLVTIRTPFSTAFRYRKGAKHAGKSEEEHSVENGRRRGEETLWDDEERDTNLLANWQ